MSTINLLTVALIAAISTATFAGDFKGKENMKKSKHIIDFAADKTASDWQVVNDGVMGGLSDGNAQQVNNSLIFSGSLSKENNGGFTSIYRKISKLPEDVTSVSIRIKGDGNRYQLRMRSQAAGGQIAYKIEFATDAERPATFSFNLADFKASFRGRIIDNAPLLKAETISHLGFLIAAEQPADFTLSVCAIEFY